MEQCITNYLKSLHIGRKQSYKNLAIFPLLSTADISLNYFILDEALSGELIDVSEVDKGGSVPELKVINKAPEMILILDGEELVGAKQNRIVNTTILIQKKSTIVIPVSCVEQGRWSYESPRFYSKKRVMSPNLRAMKAQQVHRSVRETGEFRSDQGALWEEISEKAERMEAPSDTMALGDIYEKEMPSMTKYVDHFTLTERQVGAIFMINGEIAGLDSFGKPETFSKVFKKLVESYALDALDWYDPKKEFKVLKGDATQFITACRAATVEAQPSVGLGTDCRMESKKITGFALAHDEKVLHLSVFARRDQEKEKNHTQRMERFSNRRRRNRT